jgi:hypothetical protein
MGTGIREDDLLTGQFLCGCWPLEKRNYISDKRIDSEGYEVCPEHGQRLYGWNTRMVHGVQGQNVLDYSTMGKNSGHFNFPDVEDRRDNRDPQEVWAEMQLERMHENAELNGG